MNLAFVLLADDQFPGEQDVAGAFASYATPGQRLVPRTQPDALAQDILEFELRPGGTAFVTAIRAAVPNREADEAARFSISALGTGWTLPPHKAHLLVFLQDGDPCTAVEELQSFTSLLAAVSKASGAVGIYWGNSGATHDPRFFGEVAEDPGIVPRIMVWTGVGIGKEEGERLGVLSLGMKQLGLPDLYLRVREAESDRALPFFFDLLSYLAESGKPVPEGDTVGRDADERLTVNYVPSPLDPETQVWRVELP
jgi:hypothetical protein